MRKTKKRLPPAGAGFSQEQTVFDHQTKDGSQARHRSELAALPLLVHNQAAEAGLLSGEKSARLGGRVTVNLLKAARAASGIRSDTELLEYALSKVALEDDFGRKLLARKGSVPRDVDI